MKIKLDRHIQEFLEEFNLGEREVSIYLTLLKTGPNTIMNLARETGIKRSTTHNNVEELIKKGLISQTNFGERRMVVAEDPEKLKFLMDQKKWRMKKLEDNLGVVIERINEMVPEAREKLFTQVKYYQGVEGFREVCQRSVDRSTGEVRFIGNIEEWRKVYTEDYGKTYYIPARLKKNLFLKQLAVNNQSGKKFKGDDEKLLRETRLLPVDMDFQPTIIISDKELSIMVSHEPHTSIIIEEKGVADAFRQIFDKFWEMAEK